MAKFKTVITTVGAAKIAAVLAGSGSIVLDGNARMAIGDGNGTLPTPVPSQTALVHEVYRAALNNATIDDRDPKNIVVELIIPPETGGFWMREMALYDAAGTLLAVGNMAETYKPSLSEGAGRKQVIRMVIAVSDVSAVTITMDASTVMATKDYVDSEIDEHAKSRNHPDATLTAKGFTQLNNATNSTSETQAATPKAVKTVMDATNLKAPLDSPSLTGTPQAPTAPPGTNTQQLANTAFVRAAIAALINSSPGTLDTLSELAAALGNDANFATTMTNALAAKAPLASPVLTGTPMAPTAVAGTSTQQLATTAFVQAAVAALINSSPAALDTLNELAAALGNDANFATTMTNALAGKQPLDGTLSNLSGKTVAGLLQYLGMPALLDARQPINDTLTAFARLDGQAGNAANNIPYFSGKNTVTATALTAFMRSMFGKADATEVLALLGVPDLLNARQPINDTLTAFARLDGQAGNAANNIPYFSGKNTVTATALTAFMRSMFGKTSAPEVLALLGTKTAALRDVGTGANQIPDMSSFTFSNATQGFMKYPGGFIEQWFIATVPQAPSATVNGTIDVLFPNPFPNKCYGVNVNYAGITATRDGTPFLSGMVVDKFACRVASTYLNSGLDVFVRAVGY